MTHLKTSFVSLVTLFFLINFNSFSEQKKVNQDSSKLIGEYVKISFVGGREEFGKLLTFKKRHGTLSGHFRIIYFNTSEVQLIEKHEDDPPIIFDLKRNRDPNRRVLPLVMDNIVYGPMDNDFNHSISARIISKEDTVNGFRGGQGKTGNSEVITDTIEVEKFSANLIYRNGINYYQPRRFPSTFIPKALFDRLPDPKTFNEKLKRIKFLRQAQRWDLSQNGINDLKVNGPQKLILKAENNRLQQAKKRQKIVEEKIKLLFKPQENKATGNPEINTILKHWWDQNAPEDQVNKISAQLSNYSEQDIMNTLQSLTPLINNKDPNGESGTHRIEWKSKSGEPRHYFVHLPIGYSPEKSYVTFVYLHGQTSTADRYTSSFHRRNADKHGFIIISPEYVYKRRWGYNYSSEEHEAILGAVKHARTRWSLNCDRTYLLGYSQGGHATYDIASSHPNFFAGTVPYIGAAYNTMALLVNQSSLPMYIIDGENDGIAPEYNRKTISELIKFNSPSAYVEYKGRGHEGFAEEDSALFQWMLDYPRQSWKGYVQAKFRSSYQGAVSWLELMPEAFKGIKRSKEYMRAPISDKDCHIVTATWKKSTVYIKTNRGLKSLRVLIPNQYKDEKNPLRIIINGKTSFNQVIKNWDVKAYLTEVSRSKDRWLKHRQSIELKF